MPNAQKGTSIVMKFKNSLFSKWKRGTRTAAITAGVLCAVLLLNLVFGMLCNQNRWYIDMADATYYQVTASGSPIFTTTRYRLLEETQTLLSDTLGAVNSMRGEDDPVQVNILFCADPDLLIKNDTMRGIYYTALEMQKAFPREIKVSSTNVWVNPSSVDAYRTTSYSAIYQSHVIVSSGEEFRIIPMRTFYEYNSDTESTPWAYSGEQVFLSNIIAVTRAEAPICCLTTNHGEPFATEAGRTEYTELVKVIENAGFKVEYLDLDTEDIPANCRLILTMAPKTDFSINLQDPSASEVRKLDSFLSKAYSFMIFADADTPYLPNLEEYMEEWGIVFSRTEDRTGNYRLENTQTALNQSGTRFAAEYEEKAPSAGITEDIRTIGGSPKVVFGNAMPIEYSASYTTSYVRPDETTGSDAYTCAAYFSNGRSRIMYDIFRAGETAKGVAVAGGSVMTDQDGAVVTDTTGPFRVMTLSVESRPMSDGQVNAQQTVDKATYVCAVGSVEFASNAVLSTNAYGNTDTLLSLLRKIGREVNPVQLKFKMLHKDLVGSTDDGISYIGALPGGTVTWTVVLVLLPVVILAATGTVILVKRKLRN